MASHAHIDDDDDFDGDFTGTNQTTRAGTKRGFGDLDDDDDDIFGSKKLLLNVNPISIVSSKLNLLLSTWVYYYHYNVTSSLGLIRLFGLTP
ncbi:hypothetical protein HanHA300_Chr16g0595981 [Helianthus annuus]|nr:hypothetical protein HanHA300_Chr16g0595981 [Helianthus annuus]